MENIKTINLTTKVESLVNSQKLNEVRNQKVVNFISDLKNATNNVSSLSVNENFKKGLKEVLNSYDELIAKKQSLNQDKNNDKNSGNKGSSQNLAPKNGKKILVKGSAGK